MLMLIYVCFKMQLKSCNIRNTADNLWCSFSREFHGNRGDTVSRLFRSASSRCPAGPGNAGNKASIDHIQVANRDTCPPSASLKGHMA
jgi:hypothetical protein